jgi:predicted phage terminase large subunit-like protein
MGLASLERRSNKRLEELPPVANELEEKRLPSSQPGKQTEFLESSADIVLYGGSAGGGKTVGLLLDFAREELISNPNYGGIIFRRTSPQIRNEGGLLDASSRLYPTVDAKLNQTFLEWKFSTGATVRFAHLQHEKNVFDWQGTELARVGFDELTHFTKKQFIYIMSRCRSTIGIKPLVRATCNPDAESWVAELVEWYIDEAGYPIPERSGVVRWFVVYEDNFVWADTEEELRDRFPGINPKSFTFIPSKLTDNPILMESDPGYLANLQMQHSIDRARLLDGNWRIRPQAGKVFNSAWFLIIPVLSRYVALVRFWDMAATAKEVNEDSFYTAGILLGICEDGSYEIVDAIAEQLDVTASDKLIIDTAKRDGKSVYVAWEEEGGSAGKRVTAYLEDQLKGFNVEGLKPQGDKLTRAKPVAKDAEQGRVKLVEGSWCDRFKSAIHMFDGTPKPLTNDYCDALSGAHSFLSDPEKLSARQYSRFLRGEI